MELIGVGHLRGFEPSVAAYIDIKYPGGPGSLMLELPPNWPELRGSRSFNKLAFAGLDEKYRLTGTRIIYGDRGRILDMHTLGVSSLGALIRYLRESRDESYNERRNKGLVDGVREERPCVAVVGRYHADYLKRVFPDEEYTVFEPAPRNFLEWPGLALMNHCAGKPYKPDRVLKYKVQGLIFN